MSYSLMVPIDKLMQWRVDNWKKYGRNESNLSLRIHCDQLFITSENIILESLNMKEKIKGIHKEDILVLFICRNAQEIRKIKFQIKSNFFQCLEELKKHFPVVSHNSKQPKKVVTPKYRNIEEVITYALNKKVHTSSTADLPASFKNFVKLCLLDPTFPKIVQETQNILKNETNEE